MHFSIVRFDHLSPLPLTPESRQPTTDCCSCPAAAGKNEVAASPPRHTGSHVLRQRNSTCPAYGTSPLSFSSLCNVSKRPFRHAQQRTDCDMCGVPADIQAHSRRPSMDSLPWRARQQALWHSQFNHAHRVCGGAWHRDSSSTRTGSVLSHRRHHSRLTRRWRVLLECAVVTKRVHVAPVCFTFWL